jgi:hypothetical protein
MQKEDANPILHFSFCILHFAFSTLSKELIVPMFASQPTIKPLLITTVASILISATLLTATASAEWPRSLFPRFAPVPQAPASPAYHAPVAGPRPYYGEALGATYYNWGYFGAHPHSQLTSHRGYDHDYCQFGYSRGY